MLTKASIPHATRNLRKSGRSPKKSETELHTLRLLEATGIEDINTFALVVIYFNVYS